MGLYVNIAAVQKQYGDFLEQSKQAIKAQLEEAMGEEAGKTQTAWTADILLNSLFTALKVGDRLALSLDFQADGLTIAGLATVKGDSPAARDSHGPAPARASSWRGSRSATWPMSMGPMPSATRVARRGPGRGRRSKVALAVRKAEDDRIRALEDRLVIALSIAPMKGATLADPAYPSAAVAASRELFEAPGPGAGREDDRLGRPDLRRLPARQGPHRDRPGQAGEKSPARHAARSPGLPESHGRKRPHQPRGQRRQAVLRGDERIRRSGQGPDRRHQHRRRAAWAAWPRGRPSAPSSPNERRPWSW